MRSGCHTWSPVCQEALCHVRLQVTSLCCGHVRRSEAACSCCSSPVLEEVACSIQSYGINGIVKLFRRYLQARCRSCRSSNSVKALKQTQSRDLNQLRGPIISSSTVRLLMEKVLLPVHHLSDACTKYVK